MRARAEDMTQPPIVTGEPRWAPARERVARLRELPPQQAEANVQGELHSLLQDLFPALSSSELTMEKAVRRRAD